MIRLKYTCFKKGLTEGGTLHLRRPSFGLWLIEGALLHLKRASFGFWPIERGIFKERFLLFKANGKRNIKFETRFFFWC